MLLPDPAREDHLRLPAVPAYLHSQSQGQDQPRRQDVSSSQWEAKDHMNRSICCCHGDVTHTIYPVSVTSTSFTDHEGVNVVILSLMSHFRPSSVKLHSWMQVMLLPRRKFKVHTRVFLVPFVLFSLHTVRYWTSFSSAFSA